MTVHLRERVAPFAPERIEAIAKVLGDTDCGLSGREIGHILAQIRVGDPTPTITKWMRLYNALAEFQNREQIGNHVVVFMNRAMDPAKYSSDVDKFHSRRDQLNVVLAFCGMTLGEDGKIRKDRTAASLDEALARASRFQAQLRQRGAHADIFAYCSAEILAKNYFHTVFEAMKSITAKIRSLSGLAADGVELVERAFSIGTSGTPLIAINSLDSETLRGEQRGFVSLLKGLYGTVRNPLAHEPKIDWEMDEQDALDILTMISLIHRKLDKAHRA
ncbi:MAG TPA: TIGR02391 family protein [Candidatus Acidoferrales bacterium]|nr:TIGR02391 family protein [Candidatus Acidoferrales bacterium]